MRREKNMRHMVSFCSFGFFSCFLVFMIPSAIILDTGVSQIRWPGDSRNDLNTFGNPMIFIFSSVSGLWNICIVPQIRTEYLNKMCNKSIRWWWACFIFSQCSKRDSVWMYTVYSAVQMCIMRQLAEKLNPKYVLRNSFPPPASCQSKTVFFFLLFFLLVQKFEVLKKIIVLFSKTSLK